MAIKLSIRNYKLEIRSFYKEHTSFYQRYIQFVKLLRVNCCSCFLLKESIEKVVELSIKNLKFEDDDRFKNSIFSTMLFPTRETFIRINIGVSSQRLF